MATKIRVNNVIEDLCEAVANLDTDKTLLLVKKALSQDVAAKTIIHDGLCKGIEIVGEKCETGDYFFPQLVDFSETIEAAMAILKSEHAIGDDALDKKIVIGVVEGDIHEIGKNILKLFLGSYGFHIIDLGKDVPASAFIETAVKENAQIICMSTYLSTSLAAMNQVIDKLGTVGLKDRIKVVVGGEPVTETFAREIGADGYAPNAATAIDVINSLLSEV